MLSLVYISFFNRLSSLLLFLLPSSQMSYGYLLIHSFPWPLFKFLLSAFFTCLYACLTDTSPCFMCTCLYIFLFTASLHVSFFFLSHPSLQISYGYLLHGFLFSRIFRFSNGVCLPAYQLLFMLLSLTFSSSRQRPVRSTRRRQRAAAGPHNQYAGLGGAPGT